MFINRKKNKKEAPMAHALAEALAITEETSENFGMETEVVNCFFGIRNGNEYMSVDLDVKVPTDPQEFCDWLLGMAFIVAHNDCTLSKFGMNHWHE